MPPPPKYQGLFFTGRSPGINLQKSCDYIKKRRRRKIWIFKPVIASIIINFVITNNVHFDNSYYYLKLQFIICFDLFCFKQEIFINLSIVEKNYFVCNVDDFKFLADMIQHVPLHLRARYVFCCAPINRKLPFICTMFLKVPLLLPICELLILKPICTSLAGGVRPPCKVTDRLLSHQITELSINIRKRGSWGINRHRLGIVCYIEGASSCKKCSGA